MTSRSRITRGVLFLVLSGALAWSYSLGRASAQADAQAQLDSAVATVSAVDKRLETAEQLLSELHWIITFERGLYIIDVTSYYDSLRLAIGGE